MKTTDPIISALVRAAFGAILTGATVFFAMAPTSVDMKQVWYAVGAAVVGVLVQRAGLEGAYDQKTKPRQNVPPASSLDGPKPE